MERHLDDLELFLEACEHPVNLDDEHAGYSVMLDFAGLKTRAGKPRMVYRLYNREKLTEKLLQKGGLEKELRGIIKEVYEQEMPDLEVEIKAPNEYAAYILGRGLLDLNAAYGARSRKANIAKDMIVNVLDSL